MIVRIVLLSSIGKSSVTFVPFAGSLFMDIESGTVYPGIDDIAGGIHQWIVQVEYLIKPCVENISKRENCQKYYGRAYTREGNVQKSFETPRTIYGGSFMECRINSCKCRKINDCVVAKAFPYIGTYDKRPEHVGFSEE